ncbi:MAG: pilus assembly protein TadG-related protein [Pseudomonadota bacterium]
MRASAMLKRIKTFLKNSSGNVAMTTAITIIPIMAAVTATIDYTRYTNLRTDMINSADAANLAVAQALVDQEISEQQLEAYALNFFKANIGTAATPDM